MDHTQKGHEKGSQVDEHELLTFFLYFSFSQKKCDKKNSQICNVSFVHKRCLRLHHAIEEEGVIIPSPQSEFQHP